ncbi:MAG: PQQ-dependent sugar dehydrogenase, partial [Pantoea piersonii]|uniref:PQQ-dependent sugar dehydrogenase n=1 Tax=Pantoea piersonii TaxID=2364647 RepID=UPI002FEE084A
MARLTAALLLGGALFTLPVLAEEVQVQVLQEKLNHPWSVAFLPDNQTLLITERSGQLRSWRSESGLSQPIEGVPKAVVRRQAGLLDVVLAPDFAQSRRVWLSFTEANSSGELGAAG